MNGKKKCEALKKIRMDIAKANNIKLEISECTHTGDCLGTCPRCESEVHYLERALEVRRKRGLKVAIAGVSAGLVAMNATSCDWFSQSTAGDMQVLDGDIAVVTDISDETGSICAEGTEELVSMTTSGSFTVPPEELIGELAETDVYELEGDVAFIPDIAGGIVPLFDDAEETTAVETDTTDEKNVASEEQK